MKFALPFVLCLAFAMPACNTIENRRSFYAPKKADGPYTRALEEGTWRQQKTVDQQYAEARRLRGQPKITPGTVPQPSSTTTPAPANEAL